MTWRRDALDEIAHRLRNQRPVVTPMRFCVTCASDWDSRHFTSCPWCAAMAAKLDRILPTNPITE